MANKKFYILFKTTIILNNTKHRYLGKYLTYLPRDKYLGELDSPSLKRAIERHGRNRFEREIIQIFDNEEDLNAEYERRLNEILSKPSYRWFNRKDYKSANKKPKIRKEETNKKQSETMRRRFDTGDLVIWNKNYIGYQKHTEEFKKERSEKYKGEGNPNYKGGPKKTLKSSS